MEPGEVWTLPDGTLRLVVSHANYNLTSFNQVVTCQVVASVDSYQPLEVRTAAGSVLPDRIMTHPRNWLTEQVTLLSDSELAAVRSYLAYLLCGQERSG